MIDPSTPTDSGTLRSASDGASPATASDLESLQEQLGREPRGVVGIAARCKCGAPLVVVTRPRLADGTPFPTTFYLPSPALTRACCVLEAEGVLEQFNLRLQTDETFAESYRAAHEDYLRRRARLGVVPEIDGISAGGLPSRVKCLHAAVGHSLAAGSGVNLVGDEALQMIEERGLWHADRCACET